jgi:hypothetical protein
MTGYIYCVKKGQTISERKKEISRMSQKPVFDEDGNPIDDPASPEISR